MSLPKWPELLGPDAVDTMVDAVTAVAERSFFAAVERCDDHRFEALSNDARAWWAAAVRFTEGDDAGIVSCTLSDDLARGLFDAFNARDPLDAPPDAEALVDLIGEFCNMVCGTWLTRLASHQTFSLSRPTAQPVPERPPLTGADTRLLLAVNDLPLAVEVRITAKAKHGTATDRM